MSSQTSSSPSVLRPAPNRHLADWLAQQYDGKRNNTESAALLAWDAQGLQPTSQQPPSTAS